MDSLGTTQRYHLRAATLIIVISMMEKMTKFVIVTNIIIYLTNKLGKSLKMAVEISCFAEFVTSIVPLIGHFLANKSIGRQFIMSALSSFIYFVGLSILAMSEIFPSLKAHKMTYILSSVMICLGIGGLKPCVDTLSGDDFEVYPLQKNVWKIVLGILEIVGIAVFSYFIDVRGWRFTYLSLGACMTICIMIIVYLGNETYQQSMPEHSDVDRNSPRNITMRMLALLWFTCMMFGVFNVQTSTLFSVQSEKMTVVVTNGISIQPITIYFVSLILMKFLIILLEKIVAPIFSTTNKIFIFKRIVFGMLFACVAMIFAAFVEKKRLGNALKLNSEMKRKVGRVEVTIFWILPQGILLSVADTFIFIGVEEFLSDCVPTSSFSLATRYYTTAKGTGSLVSFMLIKLVNPITQDHGKSWIDKDLNSSHIYKFYELLIWISIFSLIILMLIYWKISRRSLDDARVGMRTDPAFSVAQDM